ncbi:MAG: WGR domain-containing protein, partial [Rhizobacter sp.]|nr:WGR domain-containing protein [Chlorobiales bacterium]
MAAEKTYLELSDGTSHKFYEVSTQAATVYIRYGRIGTDGTTQVKTLASEAQAKDFAAKKLKEKTDKGYTVAKAGETEKRKVVKATDAVDLEYVKSAPLAPNHWQKLKAAYKQLEAAPDTEVLPALIARLDKSGIDTLKEKYPTRATMRYMKRRARRFLRTLKDDALYFEIASQILLAHEKHDALDLRLQWVSAEILFGASRRLSQAAHAQGAMHLDKTKVYLRTPEARKA